MIRVVASLAIVLVFLFNAEANTLEDLLKIAEQKDYKLTSLLYRKEAGKYRTEQFRAQRRPQFSISTYFGWQEYKPYYSSEVRRTLKYYYLVLRQPVYHPEIKAKIEQSELYSKVDELKVQQEKQYIKYLVVTTLLHLSYSKTKKLLYSKLINLEFERLKRLEELIKRKKETQDTLFNIEKSYQDAKFGLRESEIEVDSALKNLELIVGKLKSKPTLNLIDSLEPFLNKAEELKGDIANNFEVRIAEENIKIARSEIDVRSYNRYPKVDLSLSYSYTSSSAISVASRDKRAAITVDFPLYQGGLVTAQKLEALALEKAAVAERENTLREKRTQLEDSLERLRKATENLKYLKEKLRIDEKLITLNREGLKLGAKTVFDLLNSKESYLKDKLSALEEVHKGLTAYLEVLYLTANLTEDNLRFANSWFNWENAEIEISNRTCKEGL